MKERFRSMKRIVIGLGLVCLAAGADETGIASPCVPAADVLTLTGDIEIAVPAGRAR